MGSGKIEVVGGKYFLSVVIASAAKQSHPSGAAE
jgi:hypothetical protein